MNIQKLKKYAFAFALAAGFVIAPGLSGLSVAQAQDWRYGQDQWERQRQREQWERQRQRDRWDDRYDRRDGYYGNYGYNSRDEQKGYRDGLDRGQEDARDRRSFNPNNSSHYRKGNNAYREGFRRGYAQGYRQSNYRRW